MEPDQDRVRGHRRGGRRARAWWRALLDVIWLVHALDAVDRIEDRDVDHGQAPRRPRRRQAQGPDGVQGDLVPGQHLVCAGLARGQADQEDHDCQIQNDSDRGHIYSFF
jgi:hypothetical protein